MSKMAKIKKEKQTVWQRFCAWVNGDTADQPLMPADPPAPRKTKTDKHKKQKTVSSRKEWIGLNRFGYIYRICAVLIGVTAVTVLMITVLQLPLFGSPDNPAVNEVVERYVEKGLEETGAVNMVAGMILDYRAFDTFGESSVLFLAVTCVTMLLMRDKNNTSKDEDLLTAREHVIEGYEEDIILTKIARLLIPCTLVYGIYVVLNGHISPGGGFSGGTIMGSALILFAVSFGMIRMSRFFTYATFKKVTSCALLVYAASKAYSFFTGANHLESHIPLGTPGAILSSGLILILDICVGIVVACTMYGFYALFTKGEL
ncbi:MAG: hydrogen gas-evolving membrane-bound hydrogenase subunit E [Oscillospiraceae bacterium]